jgi:hypothetical protein
LNQKLNTVIKKENAIVKRTNKVRKEARNHLRIHQEQTRVTPSHYLEALFYPEHIKSTDFFIPRFFSGSTFAFTRPVTVQITTTAAGNFFCLFDPYYLSDTTVGASTFFANTTDFDGIDIPAANTTLTSRAINYAVSAQTISSYRLVSCCLYVISNSSNQNKQGKFGGAVVPMVAPTAQVPPAAITSTIPYYRTIQTASSMESIDNYNSTTVSGIQPNLRMVWYPCNLHDYDYFAINTSDQTEIDQATQFVFYGMGLAASSTVNIEIYLNYELIPIAGGQFFSNVSTRISYEDPIEAKLKLLSSLDNIVTATARSCILVPGSSVINPKVMGIDRPQKYDNFHSRGGDLILDESPYSEYLGK